MNLEKQFEGVRDFRVAGRCLHKLSDVLLLVLCGILADCSDFSEIYDYGKDKEDFFRRDLGLELANGIPSEDTLWRVMRHLKSSGLEKVLLSCCRELVRDLSGKQLCIDGKELRGTVPAGGKHALVQQVSAWLEEGKLCFGQVAVEEKSNEITAIPALLDSIECKGAVVTIDAMGCRKEIVSRIVGKEAHYLIALKKNNSTLYEQVSEWLVERKAQLPGLVQFDKGHGRGEERSVYVCQELEFLEATREWDGLRSVVLVETRRLEKEKEQTSRRFYISSLWGKAPEAYAALVRGHWAIENGLHWQLDVSFGEDGSQVKKDQGPENFSIARKLALFLLSKNEVKMSIKRKRKKAAREDEFLLHILKNT